MSHQEIRDEIKQTEGDPLIKQRLGRIRRERLCKLTMAAIPDAAAVITNPTYFAVAFKYGMDADSDRQGHRSFCARHSKDRRRS